VHRMVLSPATELPLCRPTSRTRNRMGAFACRPSRWTNRAPSTCATMGSRLTSGLLVPTHCGDLVAVSRGRPGCPRWQGGSYAFNKSSLRKTTGVWKSPGHLDILDIPKAVPITDKEEGLHVIRGASGTHRSVCPPLTISVRPLVANPWRGAVLTAKVNAYKPGLVVVFTLALAAALSAQTAIPQGRLIGSVEIPVLHDVVNKGVANLQRGEITLYSAPDDKTPLVTITDRSEIQSLEHGSEQLSAVVFERAHRSDQLWYRVQFKTSEREGPGWLPARSAGQFRSLHDLLTSHRAFLTGAWDRVLYQAPNRAAKQDTLANVGARQHAIVATTLDETGDRQNAWLLVVLTDGSLCDGGSQAVIAAGWIPSYSAAGDVSAWYDARGC
jgi:hypothetical protein